MLKNCFCCFLIYYYKFNLLIKVFRILTSNTIIDRVGLGVTFSYWFSVSSLFAFFFFCNFFPLFTFLYNLIIKFKFIYLPLMSSLGVIQIYLGTWEERITWFEFLFPFRFLISFSFFGSLGVQISLSRKILVFIYLFVGLEFELPQIPVLIVAVIEKKEREEGRRKGWKEGQEK